jgi:hypothetical protein
MLIKGQPRRIRAIALTQESKHRILRTGFEVESMILKGKQFLSERNEPRKRFAGVDFPNDQGTGLTRDYYDRKFVDTPVGAPLSSPPNLRPGIRQLIAE